MTTRDEVESKYFKCRQKKDKKQKSVYDVNNEFHFNDKRALPEATRLILRELQLPPDFLSSDSTLSDVPSDDDSLDNSDYFLQATDPSPTEPSAQCVKALHTPTNAAIAKPRPKLPKVSPYFFTPLFEPNSCLPFPAVDTPSFGLIQEKLAHTPFKLLIATIFLNRTRGGVALPVLFKVLDRYPTVEAMAAASLTDLVSMIHYLGFQNQRARKCIGLAQTWLACPPKKGRRYRKPHYPCKTDGRDIAEDECIEDDDPRVAWEIAHLPGVGAYSLDSWRIFCRDKLRGMANDWKGNGAMEHGFVPEWKSVLPQDKELRAYLTWMWLKEGWVWDRQTGKLTRGSEKVMRAARRGAVAHEENGNWVLEISPVKKVANGLTEAATGEGF